MPPPSTENIRPGNSSRVKLTFLGTRGEIEARTHRHRMHSSLLVSYRGCNVMIDCGLDWLGSFELLRPSAIVLTHAHPDHAWGLKNGAPCPVYAPKKTWQSLKNCQIKDRNLIKERVATKICAITFEAFPVEHSLLAPAVGYRVNAGRPCIFYGPDLIFIHGRSAAMKDAHLHWRRCDIHALVHSQAGRKAYRACCYQRANRLVRESGRVASHHHALRLGNCDRRRAQSCREPPRDGRRAWRRNALRVRRDGAGSAIKQIRCENCDDFV
jgi:hypothetical protein